MWRIKAILHGLQKFAAQQAQVKITLRVSGAGVTARTDILLSYGLAGTEARTTFGLAGTEARPTF